ncbi:hypothetical protein [Streptomyces carpinensis]|uniref:Uncharacterized protein n=1 Tax=Streptomyces carpinensis TaxID=66369 RepID=A0ABV1VVR2_9ACTN|nr:hypothetical protein [Streptomyces carpinensis]
MTVDLFVLWLDLAVAVDAAVRSAHLWGPPALVLVVVPALLWAGQSDSARTRVRALSVPLLLPSRSKPPTCEDTCPDTSADNGPDMSGRDSRGGC